MILLGLLPHEGRPDPELLLESLDITLGRDNMEHFFQDGVVALVRSCSSAAVWPRLPASPPEESVLHVPVAVPFLEDDYGRMIDARLRWHKVLEDPNMSM